MASIEVGKATLQGLNIRPHPDMLGFHEVTLTFKALLEEVEQAERFDTHVPGAIRAFSAGFEAEASNVVHSDISAAVNLVVVKHPDTQKTFEKGDPLAPKGNKIYEHKAEFKKITLSCKGRGKSFVKLSFKMYLSDLDLREVLRLGVYSGDVIDLETCVQQVQMNLPKKEDTGKCTHTGPL